LGWYVFGHIRSSGLWIFHSFEIGDPGFRSPGSVRGRSVFAPIRVSTSRVAYFGLESGLILVVLYALANLTLTVVRDTSAANKTATVFLAGLLFSIVLVCTQCDSFSRKYSLTRELVLTTLVCLFAGGLAFAAVLFIVGDHRRLEVLIPLEGAITVPVAVVLWRLVMERFGLFAVRERILIVGTGETARQICRWIVTNRPNDYSIVGFAAEDDTQIGSIMAMGVRVQTDFASLARFASRRSDRVIVALDEKRGKLPVLPLMELRLLGVEIDESTTFTERASGKIAVETMLPSWLIFSDGFKTSALRVLLKRCADIVLSLLLLVFSAPLMVIAAVLIVLESGFPILYRQSRLGLQGNEFEVRKFRSMVQDAEAGRGPTWATEDDPRATRVGRIIRKLRIDELPQLVNVLRGEMSFVGPRPERAHFVHRLMKVIPYYGLRMTVRPGITGWAQVEYKYAATDEDAVEKLKYDLYYIKNNNLLFDLWIVLKTFRVVLLGHGAR
jgi:sugar transferase (PEP-CTERM system associated)